MFKAVIPRHQLHWTQTLLPQGTLLQQGGALQPHTPWGFAGAACGSENPLGTSTIGPTRQPEGIQWHPPEGPP